MVHRLGSPIFIHRFVLTSLFLFPIALASCAVKEPPVLFAPVAGVALILEKLAVVPLVFSTERTQVFELEIRERLKQVPGALQMLSATMKCDVSKFASLAAQ